MKEGRRSEWGRGGEGREWGRGGSGGGERVGEGREGSQCTLG